MPDLVTLELRHASGRSRILIGRGALGEARPRLQAWARGRQLFVVGSLPVLSLYEERIGLEGCVSALECLLVPDGEAAKTVAIADELWQTMLSSGGKRDSRLLTLGGGSVGDLGGFVAGCFLRGIEYCQVPTTLLAQVDASIGGKTGVDLAQGKNIVGVFHHPTTVVVDTDLLSSLPAAEIRSGLVEVIKMAALLDPELLSALEQDLEALLGGDLGKMTEVVVGAVRAKIGVVEADVEESDGRKLLNYGHTLGHALEAEAGYAGLRLGEAVAYGILFALRLGRRRGLGGEVERRLRDLLARLGLPALPSLDASGLIEAMRRDKKAIESGLVWVLAEEVGKGRLEEGVSWSEVEVELADFLSDPLS